MCYAATTIDTEEDVIWKEMPGFPDYLISKEGQVWSNITNKFLSMYKDRKGKFGTFALRDSNGNTKRVRVRFLLREIFNMFNLDVTNNEYWKEITNFPGYFINRNGEIWSEKTRKILSPSNFSGYKGVHLANELSPSTCKLVHELLLETFVGPRPSGYVCNHKDGNKHNNDLNNIEWTTYSENNKHAYRTKLKTPSRNELRGEESHLSKLSEKEVLFIRKFYKEGITKRILSKHFSITNSGISAIVSNKSWKQLQDRELTKEELIEFNSIKNKMPAYENWDCIRGSKNKFAKLREEDVIKIRKLLKSGFLREEIAEKFGVTKGCIIAVENKSNWSWLKEENK